MKELQTEIQDTIFRDTEHFDGSVVTAGSPVTIATATGRELQTVFIQNPWIGRNKNDFDDVLYLSWDGTKYMTLSIGEHFIWHGKGFGANKNQIKVDSNNNGTKYEIMVLS